MMQRSESISSLAKALSRAQAEVENATKVASNPHFKSKYADLAEIINTVRPVFASHGLSIIQSPSYSNGVVSVETMLIHDSGEWLADVASSKVQKDDPQGVGSATTYLRRYAMAGFANIAQEDDDGNAASKQPQTYKPSPPNYKPIPVYPPVASAGVVELADTTDSKSVGESREGSSPSPGTIHTGELTKTHWGKLAAARKATGVELQYGVDGIPDEELTKYGKFKFGKESKTEWTVAEYDQCLAWLRAMYNAKQWIDYTKS